MRTIIHKVFRWDTRSDTEKDELRSRFDKYRYWGFFAVSFLICVLPLSLKRLFAFTLSDKEAEGGHHYGAAYQKNFRPYKYRRIKLLEVGIGGYDYSLGGQSLNSWQCYFPFALIVAADIRDRTRLSNFRTTIHTVDQSDRDSLLGMAEQEKHFDIIVDDGSHVNGHQLLTFDVLFDFLRDGGLYVIEDVQTSYWAEGGWGGAGPEDEAFQETCVGYFLRVAKYLNHAEFRNTGASPDPTFVALAQRIRSVEFQHNLIFIHKAPNTDPTNAPEKKTGE